MLSHIRTRCLHIRPLMIASCEQRISIPPTFDVSLPETLTMKREMTSHHLLLRSTNIFQWPHTCAGQRLSLRCKVLFLSLALLIMCTGSAVVPQVQGVVSVFSTVDYVYRVRHLTEGAFSQNDCSKTFPDVKKLQFGTSSSRPNSPTRKRAQWSPF